MIIYVGIFAFDTLIVYAGEKANNKKIKTILFFCAALVLALFAGIRANTVGTDVDVYARRFYNTAVSSNSFLSYYRRMIANGESSDIGYHIVTFALSRLSNNYHLGLFIYSLLAWLFMLNGFLSFNKESDLRIWPCWIICLLGLYNISLNAIRQSIAIGIMFYGYQFLIQKKFVKYIIIGVVAFLFHSSALIIFIIYLICFSILREERRISFKKQLFQITIFIIIAFILVAEADNIVKRLVNFGLLRSTYLNYLSGGSYNRTMGISVSLLMTPTLLLVLDSFTYSKSRKKIQNNLLNIVFIIIYFVATLGVSFSSYFNRIGYYFIPIIACYQIKLRCCFTKKSQKIWIALCIFIFFIQWYHDIAVMNYQGTLPYIIDVFN